MPLNPHNHRSNQNLKHISKKTNLLVTSGVVFKLWNLTHAMRMNFKSIDIPRMLGLLFYILNWFWQYYYQCYYLLKSGIKKKHIHNLLIHLKILPLPPKHSIAIFILTFNFSLWYLIFSYLSLLSTQTYPVSTCATYIILLPLATYF